ncbi:MAG: hypothetical protein ACMXYC_04450 [Candidatus Woesearchaeota archaeon]
MDSDRPIFVKVDDYNEVINLLKSSRAKLDEAKNRMNEIEGLKMQEDEHISQWKESVEEINNKLQFIDSTLFQMQE